jgi:hypothetical protein
MQTFIQGFRPFPPLQIKNETNSVPGNTEKVFIVPVYISKTGERPQTLGMLSVFFRVLLLLFLFLSPSTR